MDAFFLANAGTPLMWAPIFHLAIGNVLIGAIEAVIIIGFFGARMSAAPLRAVGANYVSALVGYFGLRALAGILVPRLIGPDPPYALGAFLACLAVAAFVASVIIEWPFLHFAFARETRRPGRTFAATLIAQVVSHVLLIAYYGSIMRDTQDQWTFVRPEELGGRSKVTVLYLSHGSGDLHSVALDGAAPVKLQPVGAPEGAFLRLQGSADGSHVHLFVMQPGGDGEGRRIASFAATSATTRPYVEQHYSHITTDLRSVNEPEWTIRTEIWPYWGIRAFRRNSEAFRALAVEVPFFSVWPSSPWALPGDQAVLAWGQHVLLVDFESTRCAVLAKGFGPAVLLDIDVNTIAPAPATRPGS